jgi:hypothetical protein
MKRFSPIMRVIAISTHLLVGMGLAIYLDTRLKPAQEETPLVEIKDIKTLRTQFNQDTGKTRLILLLSPT